MEEASLCTQFEQLLVRAKIWLIREPSFLFVKIGSDIFSALLMLALYWHVGSLTDRVELLNMSGLIFFMLTGVYMSFFFNALSIF